MNRNPTFLMANLGSEVSQIFMHIGRGELQAAKSSSERANKIIDELLNHPELVGRTEEIEIIRNIIFDKVSGKNQFQVEKDEIEDYFMTFALRALSQNKII